MLIDRLLWEREIGNSPQAQARSLTNPVTHLSHLDELDEDFCPELGGGAAEHHQLYPLGNAVAQGNGSFHGGVLLHTAIYKVILIIRELGGRKQLSGQCSGILEDMRSKSVSSAQ